MQSYHGSILKPTSKHLESKHSLFDDININDTNLNSFKLSGTNPRLNRLKSLLLTSCLAIATLSGCQTTTGMQSSNYPSNEQSGTDHTSQSASNDILVDEIDSDHSPSESVNDDYVVNDDIVNDDIVDDNSADDIIIPSEDASVPPTVSNNPLSDAPPIVPPSEEAPSTSSTQPSGSDNIEQTKPQYEPRVDDDIQDKRPKRPNIPDAKTNQQILLERARQNSKKMAKQPTIANGDNIPAFRRLMDTGVKQLKQGKIAAAQSTFTRAQRLAPQSSAVYFYLGQVALKQNQPLKAEAMARRGLVVAQSASRRTALWQLILRSGQLQKNDRVIKEARKALGK